MLLAACVLHASYPGAPRRYAGRVPHLNDTTSSPLHPKDNTTANDQTTSQSRLRDLIELLGVFSYGTGGS